jgi:C_GCAxxG_C_C family probable redox protein
MLDFASENKSPALNREHFAVSESPPQRSKELFNSGYYCAESVLLAIAENQGIHSDLIPKIATGFCSGISRSRGLCGAVSGAILSIGLYLGRNSADESVDRTYCAVQELLRLFENKFGSLNCEELIDCDLGTEEGQFKYRSENLEEQCIRFTQEATSIALLLINK